MEGKAKVTTILFLCFSYLVTTVFFYLRCLLQFHIDDDLKLTGSEQLTLATRGYKMIKKVNEGSYAKVRDSDNQFT